MKISELIGNSAALKSIDKNKFINDEVGLPTIEDIISELEKPGRDPRAEFIYAKFDDTINEVKDLNIGMKLEGTVTNVTNFGAFVDIGVHQDGLVHISQMADKFVDDPSKIVKVGAVVSVTVLEVDKELNRIALSMKKNPQESAVAKKKSFSQKKQSGNKPKNSGMATLADLKRKMDTGDKSKNRRKTAKPKMSIKQIMR